MMAPPKTETMSSSDDPGSGGINNYIWLIISSAVLVCFVIAACYARYRRWRLNKRRAVQRRREQAILDAELQAERERLAQHPPTDPPTYSGLLPPPRSFQRRHHQRRARALQRTIYRTTIETETETETETIGQGFPHIQRPAPTHLPPYSELDPQGQPPAYENENAASREREQLFGWRLQQGNGNDIDIDIDIEARQALREGAVTRLATVCDRNSRSRDSFVTGRWHRWRRGDSSPRSSVEDIELGQLRPHRDRDLDLEGDTRRSSTSSE